VITKLAVNGVTTTDRLEWGQALNAHATKKYKDPRKTDDVNATRIVSLRLLTELETHLETTCNANQSRLGCKGSHEVYEGARRR